MIKGARDKAHFTGRVRGAQYASSEEYEGGLWQASHKAAECP